MPASKRPREAARRHAEHALRAAGRSRYNPVLPLAIGASIIDVRDNQRTLGILALLGGILCWGITPVILRRLTPFLDGWTANGIRYPLSAILYWPLLTACLARGRLTLALAKRCVIPALLAMSGQVFWSLAHYELQASEIGFLVRLSMVWALVGSMVMFRDERRLLARPGFYFGLLLITGGFLVMSWRSDHTASHPAELGIAPGNHPLGVLWIVLCGASFGLYMVSVRSCIGDVDPLLAFGVVAQIVSLGLIAGMLIAGDVTTIADQSTFSWTLLISSSILGIALGHILMYTAVLRLGTAISSSCQTLMPFVTAAVGSVALAEQLVLAQWLGGMVIVTGAMVLLSLRHVVDP